MTDIIMKNEIKKILKDFDVHLSEYEYSGKINNDKYINDIATKIMSKIDKRLIKLAND